MKQSFLPYKLVDVSVHAEWYMNRMFHIYLLLEALKYMVRKHAVKLKECFNVNVLGELYQHIHRKR